MIAGCAIVRNQAPCKSVYGSSVLVHLSFFFASDVCVPASMYAHVLTIICWFISCRCSGLHRPQTEVEVLEQSAQVLRTHLVALLSAICRSVRACPVVVRATLRQLFRRVRERFPSAQHQVRAPVGRAEGREREGIPWDGGLGRQTFMLLDQSLLSSPFQNVPFIAVTSFLCLRFFSPAILSPKLFHLRERHADARTSRTLLLLAKVWACGLGWEGQLGCKATLACSVALHQLALGRSCSLPTGTPVALHFTVHFLRAPPTHKETEKAQCLSSELDIGLFFFSFLFIF